MKTTRTLLVAGLVLLLAAPALGAQKRRPRRPSRPAPKPAVRQQAVTLPSGLTVIVTNSTGGRRPKTGETVLVNYTGMLTNGKTFDSSHSRNDPIAFPLGVGKVIKGWDEGIARLGIGDTAVLVIPPSLGYAERGAGGVIPPGATLVFVVELVDIKTAVLSDMLMKTIGERGVDAAVEQFRQLKASGLGDVYTSESDMNGLGYQLLQLGKLREAVEILKLNAEEHPGSANAYDSLGEAYMLSGDKPLAIENYRKSLQLDPRNENAAKMLKSLGSQ